MSSLSRASSSTDFGASLSTGNPDVEAIINSSRKRGMAYSPDASGRKRMRLTRTDSSFTIEMPSSEPCHLLSTPQRSRRAEANVFRSSGSSYASLNDELPFGCSPSRFQTPTRSRALSRSSSMTFSVPASPSLSIDPTRALMLKCLSEATTADEERRRSLPYQHLAPSAHHHFRGTKTVVDFSLPVPYTMHTPYIEDPNIPAPPAFTPSYTPICLTKSNDLYFTRGDRVFSKNIMVDTSTAAQLCRLKEGQGGLRCISPHSTQNHVALGTDKGYVRIYDVVKKQLALHFTSKEITAMAFHGSKNPTLLSVACSNGAIRLYDTREKPDKKASIKGTRHQTRVLSLAINHEEPRLLASGDMGGTVLCWDMRNLLIPLDVGEFVQRRKKMVHRGPITALDWCPWSSKFLVSGSSNLDCTGTLKSWDLSGALVNPSAPLHPNPSNTISNLKKDGIVEMESQITSIHFSSVCKEILFTHGAGPPPPTPPTPPPASSPLPNPYDSEDEDYQTLRPGSPPPPPGPRSPETAGCISIQGTMQGFSRNVIRERVTDIQNPISTSVINSSGTRLVVALPVKGQLKVYQCWGKLE